MFDANANPEKRLFISLITRDISLTDAVVDLMDNSVNAAMRPVRNAFKTAADFHKVFARRSAKPAVTIKVVFDTEQITVTDDAAGIDFNSAMKEVFRFGHSDDSGSDRDRLSVYGIGMKRALFKVGDKISVVSDHEHGGFSLELDVRKWARDTQLPWTFPIDKRPPKANATGTKIVIRHLHEDTKARISDGRFESDLIEKISKVYSFFLGRIVIASVNGKPVHATEFEIGSNFSHDNFTSDGVSCSITAGIAAASGDKFVADAAGWFVFCNFRTVIYGDKSRLSGWGDTLPLFQPKHRPFLGLIFFTSADPELLPWTTTKGSINEDNLVWQDAKMRMVANAKPILKFLDARYSAEGTEVDPGRVAKISGPPENVFEATVSQHKLFKVKRKAGSKQVKVQYFASQPELDRVRKHFARATMSASEIGRKTFDFFLRNEVGGE